MLVYFHLELCEIKVPVPFLHQDMDHFVMSPHRTPLIGFKSFLISSTLCPGESKTAAEAEYNPKSLWNLPNSVEFFDEP
jgi:hypothetical protein